METIHVTFNEMHQTMAPVRISSGPEPIMTLDLSSSSLVLYLMMFGQNSSSLVLHQMMSAQISSGLAPQCLKMLDHSSSSLGLHCQKTFEQISSNLVSQMSQRRLLASLQDPFLKDKKVVKWINVDQLIGKGNLLLDLQKLQKNPIFRISVDIRLAPSHVPATTNIPPIDKDLEILFQPMFDEYFEQSTDSEPVPVNAPIVFTNTSVSTMIAQDAPSTSHSLSSLQVHPP
ncbi:hypothetical protein Tco_0068564, partial [Tanacetum coccineum]